jgi:hypothetical protein
MKYACLLFWILICPTFAWSQISKEKPLVLERQFSTNVYDTVQKRYIGSNWDEFGDLFFEKNGKQYWLATFTSITAPEYDFYRVFELILDSGYAKEVTTAILGGYYKVEGPNPPYYYTDIDNDGIKDIFVFDHGKEFDTNWSNWKYFNVFFKGTATGFIKTDIPEITTSMGYYHGHAIGDFDKDGDNDIAIGINGIKVYNNNGSGTFTQMNVIPPNKYFAAPFSMKFLQTDDDSELELLAPPYRDFDNACCRAQTNLLNLETNGSWTVSDFAQQTPFKNGLVSGSAQILNFPSKIGKFDDLLFRIETFDTVPGFPQGRWLTKFYRNSPIKFDTIMPVAYNFADTASYFYIDPKVADINFDGFNDVFFKENMYYTGSPYQHPINQRIWINDGSNNFNPSIITFNTEANKAMYLFVKSDSVKKYSLFMSLTETWKDTKKTIYNRIDSLIFPIKEKQSVSLCQKESVTSLITKVPVKIKISGSPKIGSLVLTDSTIKYTSINNGNDTVRYKLYNDFFESSDYEIVYLNKKIPEAPIMSRDIDNNLVANTTSNTWYKEGTGIADTTQKIKPTTPGSYTVKTTQNGCTSVMSSPYYYLVTDIIQLSNGEFIKLAPNPFVNQLNLDFNIKGYQKLNMDVFEMTTGNKVYSSKALYAGTPISLGALAPGTYIIKFTSNDNKIVQQFKMVKM